MVRELRDKTLQLSDSAMAFPLVPRFEHLGIRRRVIGKYLIFYRVDEQTVSVIHVLHGAQDYASWLDGLEAELE